MLACFGQFALILTTHHCVGVTEAVLRVASGGDNYVPTALVGNLNKAIREAKDSGFTIAASCLKEGESLYETILPPKLGLVIGSEHQGIRPVMFKHVDLKLTIPMAVPTMSFNVAHAVAIFGAEIIRQKGSIKIIKNLDRITG